MQPLPIERLIQNLTGASTEETEEERLRIEYYKNYITEDDEEEEEEPAIDWAAKLSEA
jgi:hypothetical protein